MSQLITTPHFASPDEFYASLIAVHEGLTEVESAAFNARLLLVLANHIGNAEVLGEALKIAASPR